MNNSPQFERIKAGLGKRRRAEKRFRFFGIAAISAGLLFLAVMFALVAVKGAGAFQRTLVQVEVFFDPELAKDGDYAGMVKASLRKAFPEVQERNDKRRLYKLVSIGAAFDLRRMILDDPEIVGETRTVWVPASDDVDIAVKGNVSPRLGKRQHIWIASLKGTGRLKTEFNTAFFTSGDSREPELAGIATALMGSLFSILVCLALAFPLGVMAAVYLEEFAAKNRWTELIEVNINNLAAVPSIVFGLLGLAVFLNFFHLPRSAPLVGGMVLALMTLPTIIIAGRAALKAVPPSVREAALSVGASPLQAVLHHTLPLAMPGVLTGAIIGLARALGETAPLLMIGMVAFIVDIPKNILDPATALPVQVFLWADSPERAFEEKTAAAILALLVFLICMNLLAVALRRKFEIRW
ncbi:MAG TPA: phosphate ABC transporter permease PstA [Rhodospirillales bacterium]|nr:phosphate ABC transporter permease PstA [Rhodospirillales bacterium]